MTNFTPEQAMLLNVARVMKEAKDVLANKSPSNSNYDILNFAYNELVNDLAKDIGLKIIKKEITDAR